MFDRKDIISVCSRSEALADGQLVDIPQALLDEAGIKFPSVVSVRLQNILVPTEREVGNGQSLEGRLWDMLIVFRALAKGNGESYLRFPLHIETEDGVITEEIAVVCGLDDFSGPCLTFMLPDCE